MRELAQRTGIGEADLAYGRERIERASRSAVGEVEAAEADGKADEIAKAYQALSRAASQAAKTVAAAERRLRPA